MHTIEADAFDVQLQDAYFANILRGGEVLPEETRGFVLTLSRRAFRGLK